MDGFYEEPLEDKENKLKCKKVKYGENLHGKIDKLL